MTTLDKIKDRGRIYTTVIILAVVVLSILYGCIKFSQYLEQLN